jgi:transposase
VGGMNLYNAAAEELSKNWRSTLMNHFIGIDIATKNHYVNVIDEECNQKSSFIITNNYEGFEKLNEKLNYFPNIKIGFEQPHGPLIDYLHFKNYDLYSLNPLKIKRYKETIKVSGNKNDNIDALAIANYLKNNSTHIRELLYCSSEIEKLKNLSMIHNKLTEEHSRYLNKLHFSVSQYFPLQNSLFTHFGCSVQCKLLLKYPTFFKLKAASTYELKQFLKDNKYRKNKDIDKILNKIQSYNQLISPDVEYASCFDSETIFQILLIIKDKLKTIEKEMNTITDSHYLGKYFKSLPGAGDLLSCKMLALFGDNKNRFHNFNAVQCLYGTAPKNYQSGNYHKVIMRKACDKYARATLYKFAFASLRFSKWAREYYDNQRKKGKSNSVALRALSNKWVKIIFKIWKDEIFYDENIKISSAA